MKVGANSITEVGRLVRHTVNHLALMGSQSLPVILLCVCFAAVVTVIEASFHMKIVIKNDALVPGFAAAMILRELGPVVSALLLTSRVGAGMAAELATMKITEQVEALRMLGLKPFSFLVLPRLIACTLSGFMISVIATVVCLVGAAVVSKYALGYSFSHFFAASRGFVGPQDLFWAGVKGGVFGSLIPLCSAYYGLSAKDGASGVGDATTRAVVSGSVMIILSDFVLTYLLSTLNL